MFLMTPRPYRCAPFPYTTLFRSNCRGDRGERGAHGAERRRLRESSPGGCNRCGRGWLICRAKDRKSTRLNSSHVEISYAVFCLKKKKKRDVQNGHCKCVYAVDRY